MAFMLEDRPVRPITVEQARHMLDHGLLPDAERIELLQGALVEKRVKRPAHGAMKERLVAWLGSGASAGKYRLRVEEPFTVPDRTSLPEPDIAVIAPGSDLEIPSAALLLIEVSDTSLHSDTAVKTLLYAGAGVPEYWIVNVNARWLQVYTKPRGGAYDLRVTLDANGTVSPIGFDIAPLDLEELFTGLSG